MPRIVQPYPHLQTGYARGPSEAEYPELWVDLEGAWLFGAQPQGSVFDLGPKRWHGTPLNVTWATSPYGYVPSFDGTSSIIQLGTSMQVTYPFTVFARLWAAADFASGIRAYFGKRTRGADLMVMQLQFATTSSNLQMRTIANLLTSSPSYSPPLQTWFSVAVRYESSTTGRLFINGQNHGVFATTALSAGTTAMVSIGAVTQGVTPAADCFSGQIAEVEYRGRAMTADEIQLRHEIPFATVVERRRIYPALVIIQSPTTGSIVGTSIAQGTGILRKAGVGGVAGTSTVSGSAQVRVLRAGSIAGTGAVSGVARQSQYSVGSITGSSAVTGSTGATLLSTGLVAGTSTVSGVAQVRVSRTGTIAGTSAVSGFTTSGNVAVGSIQGSATVAGVGRVRRLAQGTLQGQASVSGVGQVICRAQGSVIGSSGVAGSAALLIPAQGSITGASTVLGVSASRLVAAGTISATSSVLGVGQVLATGVGLAQGSASVLGAGQVIRRTQASTSGFATVTGRSGGLISVVGQIAGHATVIGLALDGSIGEIKLTFTPRDRNYAFIPLSRDYIFIGR